MILLRPATVADAAACAAIERAALFLRSQRTPSADDVSIAAHRRIISRIERSNGLYLVAVDKGEIRGFVYLLPRSVRRASHVYRFLIAVDLDHGGRGIGSSLAGSSLAWAHRNERIVKIEVIVRSTNYRARSLYAKFGFIVEGRLRRRRARDGSLIEDITMAYFPMGEANPAPQRIRRKRRVTTELQP
jgi:RimJ/RimL family protein N-acetyltransferase